MPGFSTQRPALVSKQKLVPILSTVVSLIFFIIAIIALRHELRGQSLESVMNALHMVPTSSIVLAVVAVCAIYVAATGYDALAFYFIKHKIPYRSIAFTSFIGHALANNIGFAAILNSSVRLRFYLARGVTAIQVLQVVAFTTLTFWLGFSSIATVIFLFASPRIIPGGVLHFATMRPLGLISLAILIFYLLWSATHQHQELRIHGQSFRFPPLPISILQILVSATEWTLGATILYVLLPHSTLHLSFPSFLGIFLLAQISGLISQVPGGIGVFESIVIARIPGAVGVPEVLASLIIYRLLFNLLPLFIATTLLGSRELLFRRRKRVA